MSPASASRPLPQDSQQKRRAEKENGGAAPRSSLHLRGAGCGPEGPRRKVPPANPPAPPDLAWGPGQQGRTLLPHDGHPRGHDGSPWSFHGPKPWATLAGGGAGVCLLPRGSGRSAPALEAARPASASSRQPPCSAEGGVCGAGADAEAGTRPRGHPFWGPGPAWRPACSRSLRPGPCKPGLGSAWGKAQVRGRARVWSPSLGLRPRAQVRAARAGSGPHHAEIGVQAQSRGGVLS